MKKIIVEQYPLVAAVMFDIQTGDITSFKDIPDCALRFVMKKDGKIRTLFVSLSKAEDVKDTNLSTEYASSILAEKLVEAIVEKIVSERFFGPTEEDNQIDYSTSTDVYASHSLRKDEEGYTLNDKELRSQWLWSNSSNLNHHIATLLRGDNPFPANAFPNTPAAPNFDLSLVETNKPNRPYGVRITMREGSKVVVTLEERGLRPSFSPGYAPVIYGVSNPHQREVDITVNGMELVARVNVVNVAINPNASFWFDDDTLKTIVLDMATKGLSSYMQKIGSLNFQNAA